jgi:hypothetical protein
MTLYQWLELGFLAVGLSAVQVGLLAIALTR